MTLASADFDETFRAHYGRLVRSLGAATGDPEAAADAVQEAFIRAYARWRRVAAYDDPVGWVRRVALNRLRDHFRRVERGRRAVARVGGEGPTTVPAPEVSDDTVLSLLAGLPHRQRVAAALFYVADLSVLQIGEAMEISEGAVKYHLHEARRALRFAMEPS